MRVSLLILLTIMCCWVRVIPAQDLAQLKATFETNGKLASVAFSPDGKLVATTAGRSTTARLWDTSTGMLKAKLSGKEDPINVASNEEWLGVITEGPSDVRFHPDGKLLLVVALEASEVRLWNVETGQRYMTLANLRTMSNAAFSSNGRLLALAAGLQGLQVLDLNTKKLVNTNWEIKDVTGVWSVDFSSDGSTLLTLIEARNGKSGFYFLDADTGRLKATITVTKDNGLKGWRSRDGHTLITVDKSNTINLWDFTSGQLKKTLSGIKERINHLAISPDNRTLAITGNDKRLKLYDSESGELRSELVGLEDMPSFSIFSPNGRILIAEDKKGIKIWDATTGELKQTLSEARTPLAFNSDGSLLLTAGKGKTALLWQVSVK